MFEARAMVDLKSLVNDWVKPDKRTYRVPIFLTPVEGQVLSQLAAEVGMSMSTYLRTLILQKAQDKLDKAGSAKTAKPEKPKPLFEGPLAVITSHAGLNSALRSLVKASQSQASTLAIRANLSWIKKAETYYALKDELACRYEAGEPLYYEEWDDDFPQGPVYDYEPDYIPAW
jgi:hypothetical protein